MARLLKQNANSFARRIVCALVLIGVCAASLPVPIPIAACSWKDRSLPFPCQDRPCGCRDAKQCWTTCGCTSITEKLRWAKARGISPPSFAKLQETRPRSCCAKKSACCDEPAGSPDMLHVATKAKPPREGAPSDLDRIVLLSSYVAKCQGQDSLTSTLPWSVLPPARSCVSPDREIVWRWHQFDEPLVSAQADPPIPPPRLLA